MATFLSDTFTDDNATKLSAHTGEIGATWTLHPDEELEDALSIQNNRCVSVENSTGICYASGLPAGTEYDVTFDVYCGDILETDYTGVLVRMDTTADLNGYMVRYVGAAQEWQLYKYIGGSATKLEAYEQVLSDTQTYAVVVRVRDSGNTIEVDIDSTTRITSTNTDITAAGRVGITADSNTGYLMDNLTATDVGGGGGGISTVISYYHQMVRNQ